MGIDLDKIRERMERLKNKGATGIYFRPEDGEQSIRIVPVDDEEPFRDYYLHYGVGNEKPFLCPQRQFGQSCAACDFASALYRDAVANPGSDGKPDRELLNEAKKFFAKQRFYSPIIARGKEDVGVKWWGYSKTIYEKLMGICLKPEKYGDITHDKEGRDIELTYLKKKGGFPDISIELDLDKTTLCSKELPEKECTEMLKNIPDIDKDMIRKTPAEVQMIMNTLLKGDDKAINEASNDVEKYGSNKKSEAPKETDEISEAFGELIEKNV